MKLRPPTGNNATFDSAIERDMEEEGGKSASSPRTKMSNDDILAEIKLEVSASVGANNTTIEQSRRDAIRYYNGDYYGDEQEGRSAVVTTEVRDTIESIMPQLMKIFASTDEIVNFEATEVQQDLNVAKQATDYANYIMMKDNDGFMILYQWFKDALMLKNGIVKCFWDTVNETQEETYEDLLETELMSLLSGEDITPVEVSTKQAALPQTYDMTGNPVGVTPVTLYTVKVERRRKKGRVRICPVPPDQFLISQRAESLQAARYCGHRVRMSASDLRLMGVKQDIIDQCKGSTEAEFTLEREQRFLDEGETQPYSDIRKDSTADVWVTENYIKLDTDGDGISERWRVLTGGDNSILLKKSRWDGPWPFASLTPTPQPHKFFGLSIYDMIKDIQRIKSTLTRQLLDNVYSINNNRMIVVDGQVNLDDVLTNRPNGVIRATRTDAVVPMMPQPVGGIVMPLLEYMDTLQEQRTGVTKYNQGMDSDSLNKTATGVNRIMAASQERILLIARVFAETGVKDLFKLILKNICQHQDKARVIRLRGEWITMDPSQWNEQMDVTVNVALGTNSKQEMLMHLQQILAIQKETLNTPLTDFKKVYNTLARVVENAGLKSVEPYFNDPEKAKEPYQAPPSDAQVKSETSLKSAEIRAKTDVEVARIKAETDIKLEQMKLQGDMMSAEASRQETKDEAAHDIMKTMMIQKSETGDKYARGGGGSEKAKKKPKVLHLKRDPVTRELTHVIPMYDGDEEEIGDMGGEYESGT
jgi:hypothetical protein